ncbi:hypothetical protein [Lacticaseibacillus saniviri]|uniref:Uncharacterized protein n=1 Tax=Lacticaseibacillus saniviri JCM 17471 = DSM 24301 TaxID=1293598 RepID=A0A0R2MQK4_9LACO|nr:hypothetical protein [Lacticaseibacillus saniviri]KRO15894.1 hypothetical protein IV56_GL002084 [Lacticaseibacillus saniviri JCM 17471 = DSM 24301]
MYKVIKDFTDKNSASADPTGQKHIYWSGDNYPFKNYLGSKTKARVEELVNGGFIEAVEESNEEVEADGNNED